jgi:hypothetical protein
MPQALWLVFGPKRIEDHTNKRYTRSWSLLVSEDKHGIKGTWLAPMSMGSPHIEVEVREHYNLSDIPPGEEGVSGHVRLGLLLQHLSPQELRREGQSLETSCTGRSISQTRQLWCIMFVKHLEASGLIEPGAANNLFSHAFSREAIAVSGLNRQI